MKEKLPQILTVLGLLMYPIARAIYPKMLSETSEPVWVLYTGAVLTGVFSSLIYCLLKNRFVWQTLLLFLLFLLFLDL